MSVRGWEMDRLGAPGYTYSMHLGPSASAANFSAASFSALSIDSKSVRSMIVSVSDLVAVSSTGIWILIWL